MRCDEPLHPGGSLLRLITAGSVDDGKSTLIGRILIESKAVTIDQLQAAAGARHSRTIASDAQIDLALLTDGLESEREQGITIDVAYRYFRRDQRVLFLPMRQGMNSTRVISLLGPRRQILGW